ncbi:MAG: protein kinase domain-containing protein, partial [Gemmataceae bacterium]
MTTPEDAKPNFPTTGESPAEFAELLAKYDDALASGRVLPNKSPVLWNHLSPEAQARLDGNRHVLDMLESFWPRTSTNGSSSELSNPFGLKQTNFGRFRTRRVLGSGGCGVVFLADDPLLARAVALKIPRPEVIGNPDLRKRFLREAQAAAVMNHPNIVPVYEACSEGGFTYIAAEFCPGPTLSQWLLH